MKKPVKKMKVKKMKLMKKGGYEHTYDHPKEESS